MNQQPVITNAVTSATPLMYTSPAIMVTGVLISLMVVLGLLYFILKMAQTQTPKDRLITLVSMGYIILLGIFLVDKLVALRIELLSATDSATLFSYVKDISTLVFGYYFGTQVSNGEGEKK